MKSMAVGLQRHHLARLEMMKAEERGETPSYEDAMNRTYHCANCREDFQVPAGQEPYFGHDFENGEDYVLCPDCAPKEDSPKTKDHE